MSILKIEKAVTQVTIWRTVAKYQLQLEGLHHFPEFSPKPSDVSFFGLSVYYSLWLS